MAFVYQEKDWPHFKWDLMALLDALVRTTHKHGILSGQLSGLSPEVKAKAELESLTSEILAATSFEGTTLRREAVRSALSRKLGIHIAETVEPDPISLGYAALMQDAIKNSDQPLSAERMFAWRACVSQQGAGGVKSIISGAWRTAISSVKQAFSGSRGEMNYDPPAPECLAENMQALIAWYNLPYLSPEARESVPPKYAIHPVLEAGICHFWLMVIRPFEKNNWLFAQVLADSLLSRYTDRHGHFYSISAQLQKERRRYFQTIEHCVQNGLDITPWLLLFIEMLERAVDEAMSVFSEVLERVLAWEAVSELPLNQRQKHMLHYMFDSSKTWITTASYARYVKCSPDTALRDIRDLIGFGVLERSREGGRNTRYELVLARNGSANQ
ncbi:MAG: Fic family protein [Desulfovibrionaceae bacterium]|nr:Fic family protein [Desulfovibrionaceae bacterium]